VTTLPPTSGGSRRELEEERAFVLRSLEDIEAERAAGDLSDDDYRELRDAYTARAASVLKAIDGAPAGLPTGRPALSQEDQPAPGDGALPGRDGQGGPGSAQPASATRRRKHRRLLATCGATCIVAGAALALVLVFTGDRLPGDTATGSATLGTAARVNRELAQAETLESHGDVLNALKLYQQVLAADPSQPEALAESGWLEFEAGVQAKSGTLLSQGQQTEEAAVQAATGAWAPRLYLGSMLLAEGNSSAAVDEFRQFLADNPPAAKVTAALPYLVKAFSALGQPLPPLPAGVAPPSTTSPAP
jgi:hypothetical protein